MAYPSATFFSSASTAFHVFSDIAFCSAVATLDSAIKVRPKLLEFLRQTPEETTPAADTVARMVELAGLT